MKNSILFLLALLFFSPSTDAQILKRVLDRTVDKVNRKIEDKIIEGVSNEIANRAMKPVDDWFNDIFKKQYEATYGEPYDETKYKSDAERQAAMSAMLGNIFGNVELADEYVFSHIMDVETYDYGEKKPSLARMLVSKTDSILGMEHIDDGDQIVIWDLGKDVIILFDKKKKTAIGLPSFTTVAKAMATSELAEKQMVDKNYKFSKTGKSKKILGYQCQEYKLTSDDEDGKFYMTDQMGFSWNDGYGKMLREFAPTFHKDNDMFGGNMMLIQSEIKRKSDKKKSKWITKKVSDKGYTLKTSDYKVTNPVGETAKE